MRARMREDGTVDGADDDVARSVAELRRRAEELAVLNDLARRLAALHDTREVLDEVARQARRLLGVDVAYIMLLRADRLRIEVVDGAMGSAMRGIELESGQGLGGQVLATGRPLSSERYLADNLQYAFLAYLRADIQLAQPTAFVVDTGVRT